MKWTESYRINSHDLDAAGNIRVAALMRYMQETAYCHMAGMKPSAEELRAEGRVFLLARAAVSVYDNVSHGDTIEVTTWATESKGVAFGRCFSIRANETLISEAETVWTFYDFEARKILRVGDVTLYYGTDEELGLDLPRRLSYPDPDSLVLQGCHTVIYADVDENRHMNNTVYPDVLSGFVPEIKDGTGRVVSMYINYSAECREDDEMRIYRSGGDGEWYFKTLRSDGRVNVEAKIITE